MTLNTLPEKNQGFHPDRHFLVLTHKLCDRLRGYFDRPDAPMDSLRNLLVAALAEASPTRRVENNRRQQIELRYDLTVNDTCRIVVAVNITPQPSPTGKQTMAFAWRAEDANLATPDWPNEGRPMR